MEQELRTEQEDINNPAKTPRIKAFRLLINSSSEFTARGFSQRVTECGGSYERSRGTYASRSVRVPNTEPGKALVEELLAKFPRNREDGTRLELLFDAESLPDDVRSVAFRCARFLIKEEHAHNAVVRSLNEFRVQYQAAWVAYDVRTAKERRERFEAAPMVLRQAILACVKDARAAGMHDDDIGEQFIWLLSHWRTTEVA